MHRLALFAASAALPLASVAAARDKPCLAPDEVAAVVSTVAPAGVLSAARQCRPALPADAYLRRSAPTLAAKLRPAALAALPAARGALSRIAGVPLPRALSDSAIMSLIEAGMTDQIVGKLKPAQCAVVSRALEQLDPLPAANFVALVAALAELGSAVSDDEGDDDVVFTICRTTS